MVHIERVWAMPNKWTFQIKPIRHLLNRYVGNGKGWADPFAGNNSPAEYTNDLNPECKAKDHLLAEEWANNLNVQLKGVLFDPPYSGRQVKECYNNIGIKVKMNNTNGYFYRTVKDCLSPKIQPGGYAICCGWNSVGFGMSRGFELVEILLVCHGGNHNDTIVTVERKLKFKPLVDVYNQV